MRIFSQMMSVAALNFKNLPSRVGTSLVIVIGSGGVVAVLVAVLAMAAGMSKTLQSAGRDDRAIVLRNGSASESGSALSRDAARQIVNAPGIKHDNSGAPIASAEPMRLLKMFKHGDQSEVTVPLRGVGSQAFVVRPEIKIVEGRMFNRTVNEVIVGKAAKLQYQHLELGDTITSRTATWTVVGVFTSNGDAHESEILADADTVASGDSSAFASVTVLLDSPGALQTLKDSLSTNPALKVDVLRERDYYAHQSNTVSHLLSVLVYVVGSIMAIGAIFGALNTMYSAVSTRAVEIATLRALGFGASSVLMSVLLEAVALATLGGVFGAFVAWLFLNGHTVSTTQGTSLSQLIFDIAVTPRLAMLGILGAAVIGVVGGLLPAIRAARLPIATALRAV